MTSYYPKSIRVQLFLMVLIVACPAVGIIAYSGFQARTEALKIARTDTQQLANMLATEQQNLVVGAEQLMTALAQLPDVKRHDAARVEPILRELHRLNPMYSNIFVASLNGDVWVTAVPVKPPFNVGDRRYFRNALASGRLSSGEYVVSRATARPVLNLAYPLKDDQGAITGVIGLGISLDRYRQLLDGKHLPPGTSYVLTDHRGIILSRALEPEKYIGKPYTPETFRQMQQSPDSFVTVRPGISGERRIITLRKLSLPGEQSPYIYITMGIPVEVALYQATHALVKNAFLFLAFLGVALVLAWLFGKFAISDRIWVLEQASQRLADNDLNFTVSSVVIGGELGQLAQSFDAMVRRLAASDQLRREKEALLQERNHQLETEIRERQKAMEAAEAANETKDRFLANMSHELRTPMNGVLGMIQLALYHEIDEEQRHYLETAVVAGRGLVRILNDILELTKAEAGKLTIYNEPFALRGAVAELLEILNLEAQRKGLTLSMKMAEGVPEQLSGDRLRLQQILTNLIANAIKFTHQGAVTVAVTHGCSASGRPELSISVADTGIGIPIDKQPLLFQPFTQVDDSFTRPYGGAGLGLAICREIVDKMGGSISFASEVGKGSIFTILIPCPTLIGQTLPAVGLAPQQKVVPDLRKEPRPRILVVEDDPVNRTTLTIMLELSGFLADTAHNGRHGIELWSQGGYDLIVMDVQMPVMNGIEAVKAIRAQERECGGHIPILAMTAHAAGTDETWCLEAGMDAYLAKPVDLDEFIGTLRQILG